MPEKWVTFFPNFQLNLPRCDLWPFLLVLCYDTTYPELGCHLCNCCAGRDQSLTSVLPGQISPAPSVSPFRSCALDTKHPSTFCWTSCRFSTLLLDWGSQNWAQHNQPHLSEFVQLHCQLPALLHHCLFPCRIGTQRCLGACWACSNQCKIGFEYFSLFLIIIFRPPSWLLAKPYFSVVLGFWRHWLLCRTQQRQKLHPSTTT